MRNRDWKKQYDEREYNYGSCLFCDGKEYAKYKIYSDGGEWYGLGEKCFKNKEYTKDVSDWRQPHRKYLIDTKYGLLDENEME